MRIAVIADTHNRLPDGLRALLAGADEIWHLGDICREDILQELRRLGPPLLAVRGNCDPRGLAPDTLLLERGGHTFYLVHEPTKVAPEGAHFALHGHTHVPRDETIGGLRLLNPGTVGKANHGSPTSFAWLTVEAGKPPGWQIVPLA